MVYLTYYVHCTTTDNEAGLATGWLPGKLSAKGLQEAAEMAKQIAESQFDEIIVSDLQRAVETARIAFAGRKFKTDARLREVNYGDNNGKPGKSFKANMKDFIMTAFPNGESYHDVEVRIRNLCEELRHNYDGKRVALLAHQAPQLSLDVIISGKTWPQAIDEDWRNTHAYQPGWEYRLV